MWPCRKQPHRIILPSNGLTSASGPDLLRMGRGGQRYQGQTWRQYWTWIPSGNDLS